MSLAKHRMLAGELSGRTCLSLYLPTGRLSPMLKMCLQDLRIRRGSRGVDRVASHLLHDWATKVM